MRIWIWTICLVIAAAVGAVFVFGHGNKQSSQDKEQEPIVEEQKPAESPKGIQVFDSEAQTRGAGPPQSRETSLGGELPEPLHPQLPEEIAPVHNQCADLRVPEHIRQAAAELAEQKEKAEQQKLQVLATHQLPSEIFRGNANKKAVALTVDTGVGGADGVEQILQLAKHYDISLTFFLTGCWVLENPELTQEIAQQGHSIANHTLTHLNLGSASDAQANREIAETQRILREVLGWQPMLFRKPQYAGGERITSLLADYTMISVQGYPDLGDTTGWRPGTTSQQVEALVKRKTVPGAIWVLHNLSLADLGALEEIIRFHIMEGYTIVPVEELLL